MRILRAGVADDLEIYEMFIDDEKLLRVYADAHQNLMIIVRYMLDNYQGVVEEDLFEEIKRYSLMPEMLGYPVLKTQLIVEAYAQIRGHEPTADTEILPSNTEVNEMYADTETPIITTKSVVLTNVNDASDVIEAEVTLENIVPEREYQIKVDVETNVTDDGAAKSEIVDANVEPTAKGTALLDDTVSYEHNMMIEESADEALDGSDEGDDKTDGENSAYSLDVDELMPEDINMIILNGLI